MKNWQALGEPARAAAARLWVIGVLAVLFAWPLLVFFVPRASDLDI
jgi:hypothetical protein